MLCNCDKHKCTEIHGGGSDSGCEISSKYLDNDMYGHGADRVSSLGVHETPGALECS
jgi:hypothetical protein